MRERVRNCSAFPSPSLQGRKVRSGGGEGVTVVCQRMDSFAGKNVMCIQTVSSLLLKDVCGDGFVCLLTYFYTFILSS